MANEPRDRLPWLPSDVLDGRRGRSGTLPILRAYLLPHFEFEGAQGRRSRGWFTMGFEGERGRGTNEGGDEQGFVALFVFETGAAALLDQAPPRPRTSEGSQRRRSRGSFALGFKGE